MCIHIQYLFIHFLCVYVFIYIYIYYVYTEVSS